MNGLINSQTIADNIRSVRLENALTQDRMAEILGYSLRQYRRLETEGTANLNVINLIAQTFHQSAMGILLPKDTL